MFAYIPQLEKFKTKLIFGVPITLKPMYVN